MRKEKNLLVNGMGKDEGTAGIWTLWAGSLATGTFGSKKIREITKMVNRIGRNLVTPIYRE